MIGTQSVEDRIPAELRLPDICSSRRRDLLDNRQQIRMQPSLWSKTLSSTEWPCNLYSHSMRSATHARNLSVMIPRPIPWYEIFDGGVFRS
jgi:hypothetical protein